MTQEVKKNQEAESTKSRLKPKNKKMVESVKSRLKSKKTKSKWRFFWYFILLFLLIFFIIIGVVAYKIYPLLKNLPSPDKLVTDNQRFNVATQIFDRHGTKLYDLFADEKRTPVQITDLPEYVWQASIAIEDKKFYQHHGFDPIGIIRALIVNKTRGVYAQGGSTITQQLIKKAFLTSEKSYDRKIKEIALAIITEMQYSKEQILEMYLNYISYGGTAVGIGTASETYFGIKASQLSLAQASLLAGLPQAPSRYSPFASDQSAAKNRQKEVLKNMVEMGFITQAEADQAGAEDLIYNTNRTELRAPHFVFYVRDQLIKQFGEDMVFKGGLRVTTTLDLTLQEDMQATIEAELKSLEKLQIGNGATLITKPNTGEILAMVGSKNYFDDEHDGQFNVTTAYRQPGSAIKPLVYVTALEQKLLNPGSVLLDVPTCFQNIGQRLYCPRNYSRNFNNAVTVRQALGSSLNIPAVKTLRMIGLESFIDQAQKMGISTWTDARNYGWSLSLGGGEVLMTDLATAFGSLANQGVKTPLASIIKVENYQGEVLYDLQTEKRLQLLTEMQNNPNLSYQDLNTEEQLNRVLQPEPAYLINDILQDDRARWLGFGSRSELFIKDHQVAVKTGTTNDVRDNWTIGYTPEYLVIVWVGNTDGSAMNQRLVSGVTGAAPIWHKIMTFLLTNKKEEWPHMPAGIKNDWICWTGMPKKENQIIHNEEGEEIIFDNCGEQKKELYWEEGQPSRSTVRTEATYICSQTGLPPKEEEPCDDPQVQDMKIAQDPLLDFYCLDCPRPLNEQGRVIMEKPYEIKENEGMRQYGD